MSLAVAVWKAEGVVCARRPETPTRDASLAIYCDLQGVLLLVVAVHD